MKSKIIIKKNSCANDLSINYYNYTVRQIKLNLIVKGYKYILLNRCHKQLKLLPCGYRFFFYCDKYIQIKLLFFLVYFLIFHL